MTSHCSKLTDRYSIYYLRYLTFCQNKDNLPFVELLACKTPYSAISLDFNHSFTDTVLQRESLSFR